MQSSQKQNILYVWTVWHFYEMPIFLLEVWKNYIMFALNYFSIPALLKSAFAPWRKYRWQYPKTLNVYEFFNTLISNTLSRLLGALMRVVLIFVGVAFQIFIAFAGLIIFILWVSIPLIVVAGILFIFIY